MNDLKFITITGADDSINSEELIYIENAPEWGILLSESKLGQKRYPSVEWLNNLVKLKDIYALALSGHLCGKWCRDLCINKKLTFAKDYPKIWNIFDRIQLNFSSYDDIDESFIEILKSFPEKQFIFQVGDKGRNDLIKKCQDNYIDIACLFDCSGGKGIYPEKWPEINKDIFCGYAGGIGVDNINKTISDLSLITNGNSYWIDMESKIRTDNLFDLNKVKEVIKLVNI